MKQEHMDGNARGMRALGSPRLNWSQVEERMRAARKLRSEAWGQAISRAWRAVPGSLLSLLALAVLLASPGGPAWAGQGSAADRLIGQERLLAAATPKPAAGALARSTEIRPAQVQELNSLLAEGQALEREGKFAEALVPYYLARGRADSVEHQALVMALDYRIGQSHRKLYEATGHPAQLAAVISLWEHERTLYAAQNYPAGFRGLLLYDLAGAYLALAAHEELRVNLGLAAQALTEAKGLLPDEAAVRVQHVLAARTQAQPR